MKWLVDIAKDGLYTLQLNDIYLYSKYRPKEDVEKFIAKEITDECNNYILFGLGLGYHAKALLEKSPESVVYIVLADKKELDLCMEYGASSILEDKRIHIISDEFGLTNISLAETELIIPLQWLKAIGSNHPLFALLEDIKIRQMSFQQVSEIMQENFLANTLNNDLSLQKFIGFAKNNYAVLVSAGPSLNQTVEALKEIGEFCFVLAVGSALKTLLREGIVPDAMIITDPTHLVQEQIEHTTYDGLLFYMATANHEMTSLHKGRKIILFQKGFPLSEEFATANKSPLIETGGSVATTGLSLLEFMGFQTVYLFGQDLGFKNNQTHANASTSSNTYETDIKFQTVLSNNGEYINTYSNFNIFRRWFEQKAANTLMQVYNTAWDGAKIEGIPYISASEMEKQLVGASMIDYKNVLNDTLSTK
ncbi:6-hydroxymethylpterin diphosphokinase MptE-like protein [Psychrobacillus sp.]|uniref:motility associated factor glycosyltransferase family protein n=1 Tax=Psychrobacillus sp. TaxID=1871623 RepID=UPI0028BEE38C|nr:6-hydroxymethylpterin diphosphokinase MptE-like protein [Psychrobacillus sp.]